MPRTKDPLGSWGLFDTNPYLLAPAPELLQQQKKYSQDVVDFLGRMSGITDAIKAARGEMTPDEAQMFALGAVPELIAPEAKGLTSAVEAGESVAAAGMKGFHWSPNVFDKFGPGKSWMAGDIGYMGNGIYLAETPKNAELYKSLHGGDVGQMYHVKVDANPDRIVDFEKPYSEQSQFVKKALAPLLEGRKSFEAFGEKFTPEGTKVRDLAGQYVDEHPELWGQDTSGAHAYIASWMKQRGIAGIRHDATVDLGRGLESRDMRSSKNDMVIFDTDDVKIIERKPSS